MRKTIKKPNNKLFVEIHQRAEGEKFYAHLCQSYSHLHGETEKILINGKSFWTLKGAERWAAKQFAL